MDKALADWITQAIELMLRCNSFECDGHLYCQATGTSIGASFACSYSGFRRKVSETGLTGRGGLVVKVAGLTGSGWRSRLSFGTSSLMGLPGPKEGLEEGGEGPGWRREETAPLGNRV